MASTGEAWRLDRRPALDGVRGVAVIGVVLCHLRIPHLTPAGTAGVSVFFTLSGFLITALLLQEQRRRGRISLPAFFARRALRLLPAVVVYAAVVVAISAALGLSLGGVVPALLYVGNWAHLAGVDMGLMKHTWSLSIEEQFYLVWPVLVIVLTRLGRWAVLWAAAVGIVASAAARLALWDGTWVGAERVYYGADTQAASLLLGCALAALMHERGNDPRLPRRVPVGAAFGLLAAVSVTTESLHTLQTYLMAPTLAPVAAAVVIYAVARGRSIGWLTWGPLVEVGRRSYGIYLWHFPFTQVLLEPLTYEYGWVVAGSACVAGTWAAASLSWWLVEQPFLRLKRQVPSVGAVEAAQQQPDQPRVLPSEGPDLREDLRVRR